MKASEVLTQIRQAGYQVSVYHGRIQQFQEGILMERPPGADPPMKGAYTMSLREMRDQGLAPSPKGGVTRVTIYSADHEVITTGEALCSPLDSFNRRIGLEAATGRALAAMPKNLHGLFKTFNLSAN